MKKHLSTILLVLILLTGVGLVVYPSFSNYWNSRHQSRLIADYSKKVEALDDDAYEKMWEKAVEYNRARAEDGICWELSEAERKEYEETLDVTGTGIMGYIEIPKIQVSLPIYHGTDEAILQIAVGHLEGTSLPVGEESAHCVLSGHRGLPSAKLFTDLDKMQEGDHFLLRVLDETLTYEVDQIRIVDPEDVGELTLAEGEDYCTLVTCTPYGVNSHRLLVRGRRTANEAEEVYVDEDARILDPLLAAPVAAIPILLLLLIWFLVYTSGRKRRKGGTQK